MSNFWGVILNSVAFFCLNAATVVFLHCFYDAAFLWNKKKALLFLAGAVIQTFVTFLFPEQYALINWVFLLPYCFVATFDYRGKRWTGIWRFAVYLLFIQVLTVIYSLMATVCISQEFFESMSAVLKEFNEIMNSEGYPQMPALQINVNDRVIQDILGIVFYSTVFVLLYSAYKKGVVMRCGNREIWIILSAFFLSYLLLTFVMYGMLMEEYIYLRYALAILGSVFSLLFPVFVYYTRYKDYYSTRAAVHAQHLETELVHFLQHKQTQEQTRLFRHDIRNNLLCMRKMLQEGKVEETEAYLDDLLQASALLRAKYVTGDEMLDCIVGMKAGMMEQMQISFRLEGVLAGGLRWKPVDICNVFANALDNAMEACQRLVPAQRQILMTIKSTPQFWLISIENPVCEQVDLERLFRKEGGYTSKENNGQHGIGTYNMKHTVESYGGMVHASCEAWRFILEILIRKEASE